jgi:hypothetical protein
MENYDPAFNSGARAGGMSLSCAILPSWEMELTFQTSSYQASTEFGCGSSREQVYPRKEAAFGRLWRHWQRFYYYYYYSRNAVNNARPLRCRV